jgi:hypothetical protein
VAGAADVPVAPVAPVAGTAAVGVLDLLLPHAATIRAIDSAAATRRVVLALPRRKCRSWWVRYLIFWSFRVWCVLLGWWLEFKTVGVQ